MRIPVGNLEEPGQRRQMGIDSRRTELAVAQRSIKGLQQTTRAEENIHQRFMAVVLGGIIIAISVACCVPCYTHFLRNSKP